ncbi:MAG: TAXI family TRAP transporter solute-binding subunit [Rhodobacteraceae bacterium]|nr:TAXI family TRAP transporter solute-binding subunit [Paracoccaceae bacterium]
MSRLKRAAAMLAASLALTGASAASEFITVGTGGVTGVYYPAGGAICRLVNRGRADHGIRCSVESTDGSVFNINALRAGDLDFAVVQSDVQAAAVAGAPPFADGPDGNLRAVFSLHAEPLHLLARVDSGIASVADLKGKKVNLGSPGSGTRVLADTMLAAAGLNPDDLAEAASVASQDQSHALCDGDVDASFWAAGLPSGATQEVTSTCAIVIVPLAGPAVDRLLSENPGYAAATIPGGMYAGNPDDVPSWGPKATFVTSADTSDVVVHAVVSAVFDDLDAFRKLHPALQLLRETDMITDGMTAQIHPGALAYYRERGWK